MNYYEHHIGDYMRDTAHLSMLEDAAYRRLLDRYYTSEKPLPADVRECCKLARAVSRQERDAVAAVLREFFVLAEDGHHQKRADEEIVRYQDKQRKARASAEARWSQSERNANASPNAMRTHSERNADGMHRAPVPSLQTPDTIPPTTVVAGGAGGGASPDDQPPEAPAPAAAAAATRRGSRLPQDWALPKAWGEWALAEFPQWSPAKVRLEADRFRDHWHAASGKAGTKADWLATWRNWCRSDIAHRDDARTGAAQAVEQQADRRAEETAAYLAEQARHAAQAVPPPPEVRKRLAELAGRMTAVVAEGGTR